MEPFADADDIITSRSAHCGINLSWPDERSEMMKNSLKDEKLIQKEKEGLSFIMFDDKENAGRPRRGAAKSAIRSAAAFHGWRCKK